MLMDAPFLQQLKIKLFADLAPLEHISAWMKEPFIKGLTTNPGLLAAAGIKSYDNFAKKVLALNPHTPTSFEVLADDLPTMKKQAHHIHHWGKNIYIKIPVCTSNGKATLPLIKELLEEGLAINVTAIMTKAQIYQIIPEIAPNAKIIFSVFCGRIADTGRCPITIMKEISSTLGSFPHMQLLWASPREILNIFHAIEAQCDIITLNLPLLKKLHLLNKDLTHYSKETVGEFFQSGLNVQFDYDKKTLCPL